MARQRLPEVPSEVVFRQLPMRIALRQKGLVRTPSGCETGFWDKIPHKREEDIEEERRTVAREGGREGEPRRKKTAGEQVQKGRESEGRNERYRTIERWKEAE